MPNANTAHLTGHSCPHWQDETPSHGQPKGCKMHTPAHHTVIIRADCCTTTTTGFRAEKTAVQEETVSCHRLCVKGREAAHKFAVGPVAGGLEDAAILQDDECCVVYDQSCQEMQNNYLHSLVEYQVFVLVIPDKKRLLLQGGLLSGAH